jgi:hypothetical protein
MCEHSSVRRILAGIVLVAAIVVAAGACSSGASAQSSATSETEEALAKQLSHPDWDCKVNLLGEDEQAQYIWLFCEGTTVAPDGSVSHPGQSIPAVVRDGQITTAGDGSKYTTDVKALFPPEIADRILSGEDLTP